MLEFHAYSKMFLNNVFTDHTFVVKLNYDRYPYMSSCLCKKLTLLLDTIRFHDHSTLNIVLKFHKKKNDIRIYT
jgi:hypothetical protein